MIKRFLAVAGAATIALLPATVQTASASAVCTGGAVCTWPKPHFDGRASTHRSPTPGCYNWGGQTVSNQSVHRITLYSGHSCSGSHIDLKPRHYTDNAPFTVIAIGIWGP
ncbi:peptidase inhibitor family I36 protein [Streptomyces sp. NPDC029080]|uniref:peptidase inhibitor family I36 protein n=1 Tax=Streptomyces sp. NPDC029080 TaxID=3155017 RepID=UPI00340D72B1